MSKLFELIEKLCPNGVEYKRFYDVAVYVRGVSYNKSKEINNGNNGYKLLRANNINLTYNTINFNDVKIIDFSVKVKNIQMLKKNDILICAGSGSKEHIGKVAFIENNIDYTFGGFMGVIRADYSKISPKYLFYIMTSPIFKEHLYKVSNSSTINNINNDTWKDFKIPVPPLQVQEEIVSVLDNFVKLSQQLLLELEARQKQYEYYTNKLFEVEEEVQYVNLNEIAEISTGSSNTNEAVKGGKYPFYVRSREIYSKNEYEYDENAIIIPGEGGIGEIFHYVSGKYALHQRAYRIHVIDNKLNTKIFILLYVCNV